ncbi:hypothetical protein OAA02_00595 [bacterium]|nr:hypothetical protein [bacterium]
MGTTLQGKKVKDTYKSLVKITDNSEAGSTGKQLSDGNGNDLGIFVDTDGVLGVGASATAAIDASTKTDAIIVPNGTDAQQPSGTNGMIRFNTTNTKMEYYDGAWKNFAEGDIDSVVAGDGLIGGATDGDATVNVNVDDSTIEISSDVVQVKDDGITYAKLGARFTASVAFTAVADYDVDFDSGTVFTTTSSIDMDLNFIDEQVGDVKTIIITDSGGTSSLTFDTATNTVTTLNGTYDETAGAVNVVQVICTASNTFFVTISQ